MKEFKIWYKYSVNSFQRSLINRLGAFFLILGKIIRVSMFLAFLYFIFQGTKDIGGYSREQIIFFYLSYNLIDTLSQLLFREVYRFKELIIRGSLDFVLLKPINPLLRVLLGGADPLDLFVFILIVGITIWFTNSFLHPTFLSWFLYLVLIINGLLIAASLHIFILGLGVRVAAINHVIWLYREMGSMLRIPVDLYAAPIRFFLTFIIPFGVMITFPAKVILGIISPGLIILAVFLTLILFYLSIRFWNWSILEYQSASS